MLLSLAASVLFVTLPGYVHLLEPLDSLQVVAHRVVWSIPMVFLLVVATRQWPTLRAAWCRLFAEPWLLACFPLTAAMMLLQWGIFIWAPLAGKTLVFSDRQATRMERAMANMEFGFGEGGYQPSEFIKRYLPQGTFDLLIADEAHEYKNGGSAQGQAMGVLAAKARKTLLLTGTLMGGYGDDLFHLLFRALPGEQRLINVDLSPARDDIACALGHHCTGLVVVGLVQETPAGIHVAPEVHRGACTDLTHAGN